MRIFLYEYITGGGLFSASPDRSFAPSMFREAVAMVTALATDFLQITNSEVVMLRDVRCDAQPWPLRTIVEPVDSARRELDLLLALASDADWTVLIAPECGGALRQRCELVAASAGRLLSPPPPVVALATHKYRTAKHLRAAGVSVPRQVLLRSGKPLPTSFPYPAVMKPIDGAGSAHVRLVDQPIDGTPDGALTEYLLEEFHAGTPASVAVLCGPSGHIVLPACSQRLSQDGHFQYLGGHTPLAEPHQSRARELAERVVATLESPVGYLGIDMVLDDHHKQRDVVIEINPRLTTSYCGLRRLARGNLAEAMVAVANGELPELLFHCDPVNFLADGNVSAGSA